MKEFIDSPTGRGRPGEWRRTPVEFVQRVEERLGDFNTELAEWNKAIGKEAKQFLALNAAPAFSQVASAQSATTSQSVEKKEEKKTKEDKKSKKSDTPEKDIDPDSDGFGDIEFGEFDKNKDK
jgi:NACalpha-BTF3-like transcription factor